MKFIFLFICSLNFACFTYSQNLTSLDRRYGVGNFKLESAFDQYSGDCSFEMSDNDGVKYYNYNKYYQVKIFGSMVSKVKLGFFNNKLYMVSIELSALDNFNDLKNKLSELFGPEIPGPQNEMYDDRYFWKGEKTYLAMEKFSCNSPYNPCAKTLFIMSLKVSEEIKSNGF